MIKDYLTAKEAADYCCVSSSQFNKKIAEWIDVPELNIMGKKAFRVADLRRKIEQVNARSTIPTTANRQKRYQGVHISRSQSR